MGESEEEDETTIVEQETHEGEEVDHKAEINALQEEGTKYCPVGGEIRSQETVSTALHVQSVSI